MYSSWGVAMFLFWVTPMPLCLLVLSQDLYLCKASTRYRSCVTIGNIYHCHLSRYFPRFSEGKKSNTREASLVTSRDQIARLAKPIAPYLGHLDGQARSRKGEGTNWFEQGNWATCMRQQTLQCIKSSITKLYSIIITFRH
jgi:hypothetical protein